MNKLRIFFLILSFIAASALMMTAQTVTGTIKGIVVDTSDAVVPDVSIEVENVETGLKRTVVTNEDGSFQVTFLPLGKYRVTATKGGFGTVIRENIEVTLNQTTDVAFKINPSVAETVTVTDEPPQINTTNAEVKGTLTELQIEAKPTFNQGNFLTLAETFTGFQENPTSGQNNPTASSGSSINFNGTGTRGATFQINGVNNDDISENQNRQGASLATIKEFQVLQNNFSAEFGRGYGAVVLVQTKQGTNDIKGEAFIYHNNSALNAKRHFSTHLAKPVNRRNQYGGVVGFPIFRNRLFGFLSFDQKRETGDLNFRRDVLLASERSAANWFAITPANDTPANRAFIQSIVERFPAVAPNDPSAPDSPTNPRRTYTTLVGFDRPLDDYSARFDWNATERDNLTARWQYTRQIFDNEDIIIGEATKQNNKQQNLGMTWTHIFSPNVSGEFRYGLGLRTTLVGIKEGNDTPVVRFVGSLATSIIGNAGTFPINRYQTDHQIVYNLSTQLFSNHTVKFGTDLRFIALDDLADSFSRGFYNFTATCGGNTYTSAYQAFLNGCVTTYQKGYGPFFLENRLREYNFYAEDNYKPFNNLTLNIGFRYEYVAVPEEVENKVAYGFSDDKDNYEPRVGLAWAPNFDDGILHKIFGASGNSSIRLGYGIKHGRIFQSVFSQTGSSVRFNPPNAAQLSFTNSTNLADPSNGFVFTPGAQTTRVALTIADPDLQMPYTQEWTASFERQLPWRSALRLTYSGNRGIGLLRFRQTNLPRVDPNGVLVVNHPFNAPNVLYPTATGNDPRAVDVRGMVLRPAADILCAGTGQPGLPINATCPQNVTLAPNEYSLRVPRVNERRLDPRYTTNTEISNNAWSYYHGLQIEFSKRLSDKLSFVANYTWSKAIDTNSEATFVGAGDTNTNGPNARLSRALSRFHTPHRFTLFMTYQTPFFDKRRDFLGQALGGWNVSVVWKRSQGTPFTVVNATTADLDLDGFAESRPVLLDPSILGRSMADPATSAALLNVNAFRGATISDLGNSVLGRNTFYGDGVNNVDLSFYKSFAMPWEGHKIVVRADLFNAFNHVQYGFPNVSWAANSVNFGKITTEATNYLPRNVQVSMRYVF